jgi:hypothetical protein
MSDDLSANPFQDLLALGSRIEDKYARRALTLAREGAAPDNALPRNVEDCKKYARRVLTLAGEGVAPDKILPLPVEGFKLERLRLACLDAARETGYPPVEVEQRVEALVEALYYLMMLPMRGLWQEGGDPDWYVNAIMSAHQARGPVEALAAQLKVPPGRGRTPSGGGKRRNAARDAWVAKQRAGKNPPTWDTIHERLLEIAPQRKWQVPLGGPASLAKAHERHLRHQRKLPPG